MAIEVNDQYVNHTSNKISVSDHILMIQCGYLLTRKNHEIKASSKYEHFIQRICATSIGKSVPLRSPEAMIFSSIFWKIFDKSGSILGALPSALLSEDNTTFGFESIKHHTRNRLSDPFMHTSLNPRYIAYLYNQIVNLTTSHSDTCIVLNRSLTTNENGDLG